MPTKTNLTAVINHLPRRICMYVSAADSSEQIITLNIQGRNKTQNLEHTHQNSLAVL